MSKKYFKSRTKKIPLPVFFPDATRAVLRTLDSIDIKTTKTPGVLVNTYHLYKDLGARVFKKFDGIRDFMSWDGAVISDSGGFQIMSIVKKGGISGKITDEGVTFKPTGGRKILLTPEDSIEFQMKMKTDMVVVLDDFTPPEVSEKVAKKTVDRTILWARRCKEKFLEICDRENLSKKDRPYLLGVAQGGDYTDLRIECIEKLIEIGFDGIGYGGWPMDSEGQFNYKIARLIADHTPDNYLLYGLGIGKPHEIVVLTQMGYDIFDCVLPTRDARHKRLYVYNFESIEDIDVYQKDFYSYLVPDKQKYYYDKSPVSRACDCLLCTNYSKSYIGHLFRSNEITAMRLATIHNLRFYSILMEKLKR